jgi:hypothetical protein
VPLRKGLTVIELRQAHVVHGIVQQHTNEVSLDDAVSRPTGACQFEGERIL